MFNFHKTYFLLTIMVLGIEVFIALYVRDDFIRPYVGDILVVILIYSFLKSFLKLPVIHAALTVLAFSFTVEFLQYLNVVELLNLEETRIARTIIGATFSWLDILSYIIGALIIIIAERLSHNRGVKRALNPYIG